MPDSPNILVVLADQHNASLMGCAGHSQVQTPHLDRFASQGMRFSRAYCQNPICTPSRVCILSGQYCHNHGIYGLSGPAPFGLDNLMRVCKKNDYRTAAFGKLHLPNSPRNWIADDLDRFGDTYENADGVIGDGEFLHYLEERGLREVEDSWHNTWNYGPGTICLDAMPSLLPFEHTQEVWSAREAIRFIDQSPDQPFCIQVAFQKPHHPLLPQQRFWDLYPEDLELPPTWHHDPSDRPPHFREVYEAYHDRDWPYDQPGQDSQAGPRRLWRGTLACISQIDEVFGNLLQALEDRGIAENTIVVYSSDHGAYHGIHGLPEKAPGICSDAVCRVPMIWRVPGVTSPGRTSDALFETVDISPTLLSLCGLPPLESADGLDATSLLRGETTNLHPVAVTEHPWSRSVVWGQWRLVHYQREMFNGEDTGELYNLEDDPDETRNLYADSQYKPIVEEGRRLLLEWLIRTLRVTVSNPVAYDDSEPTRKYFTADDGRAPNHLQPRFRDENRINYL